MEDDKVVKAILHYQQNLEKYIDRRDEAKMIYCMERLQRLPITVSHLEQTGVGRTVNSVRKMKGVRGSPKSAAKQLVGKWKQMVTDEDDDDDRNQSDDDDDDQDEDDDEEDGRRHDQEAHADGEDRLEIYCGDNNGGAGAGTGGGGGADDDDDDDQDQDIRGETRNIGIRHSSHRDREYTPEPERDKYDKYREYDDMEIDKNRETKETRVVKRTSTTSVANHDDEETFFTHIDGEDDQDHCSSISLNCDNVNQIDKVDKVVEEVAVVEEQEEKSVDKRTNEISVKSHHVKTEKTEEELRHNKKHKKSSKERSVDKDKEKDKGKESRSKEKESAEGANQKPNGTAGKTSSSSRSSTSADKSDKGDKHKDYKDKNTKPKHSSSSSRSSSTSKENNSKEKDKENAKELSKENKESSPSSSGYSSGKDKSQRSASKTDKQKSPRDKPPILPVVRNIEAPSETKSKERDKSKKRPAVEPPSDDLMKSPKKLKTAPPVFLEDGIDCESGASFAEALGMIYPSRSSTGSASASGTSKKEKKEEKCPKPVVDSGKSQRDKEKAAAAERRAKSHKDKHKDRHKEKESKPCNGNGNEKLANAPAALKQLPSNSKLEDVNIITSLLPQISTNYKPIGHLPGETYNRNKVVNDDEALTRLMYMKTQRTKVYSGNKTFFGKVPSLFDVCIRVLQDNLESLEYTGGVPYSIIKPVLERMNTGQLFALENHNPYYVGETDELWQLHCQKEFKTKKRDEMETWRDMYIRCHDEREAKLKSLTANIKLSQDKSIPVRQTKLAYVDSIVKPPRNVAKKQAKNGIVSLTKQAVTPSSRLSQLAMAGGADKIAVPNPGASRVNSGGGGGGGSRGDSYAVKPKKAPLMAKTLQLMKGRFRR